MGGVSRIQWISIGLVSALFLILYFGCDTKPKDMQLAETSRANTIETTGFQTLLNEAKPKLSKTDRDMIDAYHVQMSQVETDEEKVEVLKKISSQWFSSGNQALSGHYAEEIAEMTESAESWSIAGTTYALGIQRAEEEKLRTYCQGRALKCFENAISIEPDNVDHRINQAICYVDMPPQDNPMKGIQMLLGLNKNHPDNTGVLLQLARLGMRTNQFEKAAQRLEKVIELEPNNKTGVCLLAEVYQKLENSSALEMSKRCNDLNNNS